MSHKTTATLDAHTKQLGFCGVYLGDGTYMDVPSAIKNKKEFEKFLKPLNSGKEVFRITEIILDN